MKAIRKEITERRNFWLNWKDDLFSGNEWPLETLFRHDNSSMMHSIEYAEFQIRLKEEYDDIDKTLDEWYRPEDE